MSELEERIEQAIYDIIDEYQTEMENEGESVKRIDVTVFGHFYDSRYSLNVDVVEF